MSQFLIGLAAPTALFVGGGLAAKNGILVKGGGEALQEASQLDCVVFDKAGTITEGGEPAITNHEVVHEGNKTANIWGAITELDQSSSHPIAKAMIAFAAIQQPSALKTVSASGSQARDSREFSALGVKTQMPDLR